MERFGLREVGGEESRGRRPIEVYGRVAGRGRRRTAKPERPMRDRRPVGAAAGLSSARESVREVDGEGLSHASVPPALQHLGLFELVNRGYLRPNLDVGAIRNAARKAETRRQPSEEEELTGRGQSTQWTVEEILLGQPEREEVKDSNGGGSADLRSPLSTSASAAPLSHRPRGGASRPSPWSSLSTEEEQKQQETSSSSSSAPPGSHERGRNRSVTSVGALHDSFSILPSSRSSTGHSGHLPARSYDSLLDGFSQHPIFVHRGRVLTDTPEFASFQRSHSTVWTALTSLLSRVCDLSRTVEGGGILTFYGSALVGLVERKVQEPTREELLLCMAPADLAALQAREEEAREREELARMNAAAAVITATLRMHIQRQRYLELRRRDRAARLIQQRWRRWSQRQQTRRVVRARWQAKVERWEVVQQQWIASYGHFVQRHRVHVHVPSLSLSRQQRLGLFPRLSFHENQHLPRLCELSNPLISVIYLTAEPLPVEVETYYTRLLEVGGVKELPARLTFLSPELAPYFATLSHPLPLSTLSLYSPRLLSSIRTHIHSRPAVIIPADPSLSDWLLAVELGLPLYSVDVEKKGRMDSCSGALRLVTQWNERCRLEREQKEREAAGSGLAGALGEGVGGGGGEAGGMQHVRRISGGGAPQGRQVGEVAKAEVVGSEEVMMPVMAWDVFDEEELLSRLAALMVEHPAVDVWVLRVDDDREGWGVAWLQVSEVPGLRDALDAVGVEQGRRGQRVQALLAEQLMGRVVLLHPSFHPSLSSYFTSFYRIGGTILPYPCMPSYTSPLLAPTVHMLIEPNGQLTMLASLDQALVKPFAPLLSSFPSAHPSAPLHSLAAAVGKACWREGVIGAVSVDFLTLPSSLVYAPPSQSLLPPTLPPHVLTPISIHLHSTPSASQFGLFHFLMQGRYQWRSRAFPSYRIVRREVKEAREEEVRAMKRENKQKFHRASTSNVDQLLLHTRPITQPAPTATTTTAHSARVLAAPLASPPTLPTFAARLLTRNLQSSLAEAEEERFFTALPLLQLQPLSTLPLSSFFGLCRLKGVSFDVSERVGLCFMLYGRMVVGRLGVVGVGMGREEGVKRVEAVLRLMEEEWKGQDVVGEASEGWTSGEVATLRHIVKAVKAVGQLMQGRAATATVSRFPAIKRGALDVVEEKQQPLS